MVEDEQKARDEAREGQAKAERNANKLNTELEELRALLEQVSCFYLIFQQPRSQDTVRCTGKRSTLLKHLLQRAEFLSLAH